MSSVEARFYAYRTAFSDEACPFGLRAFQSKVYHVCEINSELFNKFNSLILLTNKFELLYKISVATIAKEVNKTELELFKISCRSFLTLRHGKTDVEFKFSGIVPPQPSAVQLSGNFHDDGVVSNMAPKILRDLRHVSPFGRLPKTSVIANVISVSQIRRNVENLGYIRLTFLQSLLVPALNVQKDHDIVVNTRGDRGATTGAAISLVQHVVYFKSSSVRSNKISPFVIVVSENPESVNQIFQRISRNTTCVVRLVNCDDAESELEECRGTCDILIANSSISVVLTTTGVIDLSSLRFAVCDTFDLSVRAQYIGGMVHLLQKFSTSGCHLILISRKLADEQREVLSAILRPHTIEIRDSQHDDV